MAARTATRATTRTATGRAPRTSSSTDWLNQVVPIDAEGNPPDELNKPFDDMQGNILRGHGRDQTVHIFLRFHAKKPAAGRKWLAQFAKDRATSFSTQLEQNRLFSKFELPSDIFYGVLLSSSGYRALGISSGRTPNDPKFQAGLKARQQDLADPAVSQWQSGFQGEVHAMIVMADDDGFFLRREARDVFDQVKVFADVVAVEHGRALRNKDGEAIEHFGYIDGRSQPLFLSKDVAKEAARGIDKWDPSAAPNLVLVQDPGGQGNSSFGSYFVFRKLEQNVQGFKEAEEALGAMLGLTGTDAERAGAMIVGRFENGTPVVESKSEIELKPNDPRPRILNNFNYSGDPQGLKCPFAGHIRKTNPRGDSVALGATLEQERARRIARRGITYGVRIDNPNEDAPIEDRPAGGVGLLFMCFQADIEQQFEFMQRTWANNEQFARPNTGIDPVIGQSNGGTQPQNWNKNWGAPRDSKSLGIHSFVRMQGGEYFFAPSLSMLKSLK